MSIHISQLKDYSVSVEQARYATSVVTKYVDTSLVKTIARFYNITLPSDITLTKDDVSTSDEHVEEQRSLGGSIISRLDNGVFVGLIYELLVFS